MIYIKKSVISPLNQYINLLVFFRFPILPSAHPVVLRAVHHHHTRLGLSFQQGPAQLLAHLTWQWSSWDNWR